jgi:predicted DNA binding CopG/RHH family protein
MKKQVSIRIDEEYYTKLRIELLKDGISFQEYVLDLIKKDGKVKSK